MKKLMMLSALLLLTAVCMGADKGPVGVCECPNGKKGIFTATGCSCNQGNAAMNKMGLGMMQMPGDGGSCNNMFCPGRGYWSNGTCLCR